MTKVSRGLGTQTHGLIITRHSTVHRMYQNLHTGRNDRAPEAVRHLPPQISISSFVCREDQLVNQNKHCRAILEVACGRTTLFWPVGSLRSEWVQPEGHTLWWRGGPLPVTPRATWDHAEEGPTEGRAWFCHQLQTITSREISFYLVYTALSDGPWYTANPKSQQIHPRRTMPLCNKVVIRRLGLYSRTQSVL